MWFKGGQRLPHEDVASNPDIAALSQRVDELTQLVRSLDSRLYGAERFRAPYYYLGGNRALTYLETGQPFYVDTSDFGLTPWLGMGGHWETWADRVVSGYVRPGMTIIDVGANVGYYAVKWGKMIGPQGELHAFEPNPELAIFIHENLALNGLHGHCRYYTHAVGAEHGQAVLTLTEHSTGLATLRKVLMPPGALRTHTVAVAPLDAVLGHLNSVDLIKIDVEGYEPSVIAGARQLIARSPKCAFHLEVQTGWETDGESIRETLRPLADGRLAFIIGADSSLTSIHLEAIRDYVFGLPSGLADFFFCSPEESYLSRIRQFLK